MAVQFACPCGKVLRAPDNLAGKRAKCSACGNVLTVPEPAVAVAESLGHDEYGLASLPAPQKSLIDFYDRELAEAEARKPIPCPGCESLVPRTTVVCLKCGYDARTGQKPPVEAEPVKRKKRLALLGLDLMVRGYLRRGE